MTDKKFECSYKKPVLTIKLPKSELLKYTATTPNNTPAIMGPPKQFPEEKSSRSSLGSPWTDADKQELYNLRQNGKSWTYVGRSLGRSGGAAQQMWIRMHGENHWLLRNGGNPEGSPTEEQGEDEDEQGQKTLPKPALDEECQVCGKAEASDQSALFKCSKCQNVYHSLCHGPPTIKCLPTSAKNAYYCANCNGSETNIGSALAENLHTALEEDGPKRGKKRPRTESPGISSGDEDGSERSTASQEWKLMKNKMQDLMRDYAALQQRVDDEVNTKDAQIKELKEAVESLKANLAEKPSSFGWFSNAKKRVASLGGA